METVPKIKEKSLSPLGTGSFLLSSNRANATIPTADRTQAGQGIAILKSHLVGQDPKDHEHCPHEADDLQEQPDRSPQDPIGKFESTCAINEAHNHRQRQQIPGDVGGLSEDERGSRHNTVTHTDVGTLFTTVGDVDFAMSGFSSGFGEIPNSSPNPYAGP